MQILDALADWTGDLPVALVAAAISDAARRSMLESLAARVLALPPGTVAVRHEEGRAPSLDRPEGVVLHLSSAVRDGFAAVAAAASPVGIDVERVDGGEIPWRVLHPAEAAALAASSDEDRPSSFAALWACKEAYLKALGRGLARDPASFQVVLEEWGPAILDPERMAPARLVRSARRHAGADYAVALAVLGPQPA